MFVYYGTCHLSNWIIDDRKWLIINPDLLHDITNSTYKADLQEQFADACRWNPSQH
ncbi:MAG: hypothetical protein ACT6FE_07815 [Methanosarcinaceae archaeon]